jgi:riboflavin kinase/FMN adenylyltransferase
VPPDSGIYACRVILCASMLVHDATMSVGDNPTFGDVFESQVEAHLHDVAADLYGQVIEIRIVQRIRDMINFDTEDDLIFSTAQDVERSREILSAMHEANS